MSAMIEKAKQLSAEALIFEISKMIDSTEDYADMVISAMLEALHSKVSEAEFISLCDEFI